MTDRSYKKMLEKAYEDLGIVITHYLHLGRVTAPARCDLEEVKGQDTRALGNWKNDVFEDHYSTKLSLKAMRVMAGFDKRQGYHKNPRTTYFGEECHVELKKQIFPWLDNAISNTDKKKNKTAAAFLCFMDNLRWVILQDAAVMIANGRDHSIFVENADIFKSELFLDFQEKLIKHIEEQVSGEIQQKDLDAILPGVQNRLDNQRLATLSQGSTLKSLDINIRGVIKNYEDFKDVILTNNKNLATEVKTEIHRGFGDVTESIKTVVNGEVQKFCSHIGNYSRSVTDNTEANNDKEMRIVQVMPCENTIARRESNVMGEPETTTVYCIPAHFPSFASILQHWYHVVKHRDDSPNKSWRKHLDTAKKRRFQRLARVMKAFGHMIAGGCSVIEAENKFEEYYTSNKKSIAKLGDNFARNVLKD